MSAEVGSRFLCCATISSCVGVSRIKMLKITPVIVVVHSGTFVSVKPFVVNVVYWKVS